MTRTFSNSNEGGRAWAAAKAAAALALCLCMSAVPAGASWAAQLAAGAPAATAAQLEPQAKDALYYYNLNKPKKVKVAAKDIKVKAPRQPWYNNVENQKAHARHEIEVYANGKRLKYWRDYRLEFKDVAKPGTATVKIKLIYKYSGSKTVNFKVYSKNGKKWAWIPKYEKQRWVKKLDTSAYDKLAANDYAYDLKIEIPVSAKGGHPIECDSLADVVEKMNKSRISILDMKTGKDIPVDLKKSTYRVTAKVDVTVCKRDGKRFAQESAAARQKAVAAHMAANGYSEGDYKTVTENVKRTADRSKFTYQTVKSATMDGTWKWVAKDYKWKQYIYC